MAEVLDIIQKITYEADADVIEAVNAQFGVQIKEIQAAQKAMAAYEAQLSKTANTETQKRQGLIALIDREKQKVDNLTTSIGKQLGANKQLSNSLVDVTGRLRNVSFAGSQLLREAPAFTFSLQTGILALSNNIPILLDQLKSARQEGVSNIGIFKALGQSVFSFNGIVTLGIAALSIFGDELFNTGESAKKAEEDIKDVTKAIQEQAKAATNAAIGERNRQNIGANQAKRDLEQARARGASQEEILQLQRRVSQERTNEAENELARLEVIEDATRTNYQFFSNLYQNDEYVRELTAKNIQRTLRETLGITEEAAAEEAKAIADSYNTRESVIGKYRTRKRELEEVIKDEANGVVVEELNNERSNREKSNREYEKFVEARLRLIEYLRQKVKEAANNLGEDLLKAIEDFERELQQRQNGLLKGFQNFPINPDTSGVFGFSLGLPDGEASALRDQLRDQRIRDDIEKAAAEERRKAEKELKEERRDAEDDFISGIGAQISAIDRLLAAQISALDKEREARQRNIEAATQLAEEGNTEVLRQEQERLTKLESERESAARKQIQLNSILAASNQAVAVSEAIGAVVSAASKGDPYTIAIRVAAAVAALVAGVATIKAAFSTPAFKDGVVDYNGAGTATSDSNVVRISKGESVITAKATQMYKPLLQSMNDGTFIPKMAMNAPQQDRTDEMIAALGRNNTDVIFKATPEGIALTVQRGVKNLKRGYRG